MQKIIVFEQKRFLLSRLRQWKQKNSTGDSESIGWNRKKTQTKPQETLEFKLKQNKTSNSINFLNFLKYG